ncbi:MFS transporter [Cohaesibacter haloalkalitolerans]|uniref:MFS transporter n=1 Tax=Cohaesibacter haloalkalitolerans TaxID=1162980 RepID=UPI000E65B984|nr:MFS transporter [Cohaesibacter haloalkalitolerans]
MTVLMDEPIGVSESAPTRWGAIGCLSLLTFLLVGLEFLPASLLTPIASDLVITEGQAGFAMVVSAFFAVTASLLGNRLLSGTDRRSILLLYALLLVASSLIVGMSNSFALFLVGRALVGVAVGGFWSLSTAIVTRLARSADVPRAIAILQIGPTSALVLAAPVGSFLETIIGWHNTFLVTIPLGVITLVWLFLIIPPLPPRSLVRLGDMFGMLRRKHFAASMGAIGLFFIGQNAVVIYLRPFLETITNLHEEYVSLSLLSLGLGGVAGLLLIGSILRRKPLLPLMAVPSILALIGVLLILLGGFATITIPLLVVWGMCATPLMVAWNTWMTVVIPDELEAGGGLQVALIQCSIASGAFLGGMLLDHVGWWSGFLLGSVLLAGSAVMAVKAVTSAPKAEHG